jgi:hypothetical protein
LQGLFWVFESSWITETVSKTISVYLYLSDNNCP